MVYNTCLCFWIFVSVAAYFFNLFVFIGKTKVKSLWALISVNGHHFLCMGLEISANYFCLYGRYNVKTYCVCGVVVYIWFYIA